MTSLTQDVAAVTMTIAKYALGEFCRQASEGIPTRFEHSGEPRAELVPPGTLKEFEELRTFARDFYRLWESGGTVGTEAGRLAAIARGWVLPKKDSDPVSPLTLPVFSRPALALLLELADDHAARVYGVGFVISSSGSRNYEVEVAALEAAGLLSEDKDGRWLSPLGIRVAAEVKRQEAS